MGKLMKKAAVSALAAGLAMSMPAAGMVSAFADDGTDTQGTEGTSTDSAKQDLDDAQQKYVEAENNLSSAKKTTASAQKAVTDA